jgi:hypothetical protein
MSAPPIALALRPRSATEIIDASFQLLRQHYGSFAAAAAAVLREHGGDWDAWILRCPPPESAIVPALRAAGLRPPSPQVATVLIGGLRELIATTVEDGGDVEDITGAAVAATMLLLGPRP